MFMEALQVQASVAHTYYKFEPDMLLFAQVDRLQQRLEPFMEGSGDIHGSTVEQKLRSVRIENLTTVLTHISKSNSKLY
jgi:hypothetical protein